MTQMVIGGGEVGTAIHHVLLDGFEVRLRDVYSTDHDPADVLHIALPWSDSFERVVAGYVEFYKAKLVVVHSTVPVGTCRRMGAVHSPVTGRHPNLEEGVRTFRKFFGGERGEDAANLFRQVGVDVEVVPDQETTEAGKLWATLQHGLLVTIQKEMYEYCRRVGADPQIAYVAMNAAYGEGYRALGEKYVLPVLRDVPGRIGGHCVLANARLTDTPLARVLLELDEAHG